MSEAFVTVTDHDVEGVELHMGVVSPIPVELFVSSDLTSDKTPPISISLGLRWNPPSTTGRVKGPPWD